MIVSKKILLIEPPFQRLYAENYLLARYPLALGYLAAAVRKNTEWQVLVYNADFDKKHPVKFMELKELTTNGYENYTKALNNKFHPVWQEIEGVIKEYKPDIIGLTIMSQKLLSARNIIDIARKSNENIFIIAGGPHPSLIKEKIYDELDIDLSICGEGEAVIVDVLNAFVNNRDFRSINGIIYWDENTIIKNMERLYIKDLDSLDPPYKYAEETLYEYADYPRDAFRYVMATRGCPFFCTFCGSRYIWGNKVRYRSVPHVIAELKLLLSNGINYIHFDDDIFAFAEDYFLVLCNEMIKLTPGLIWECEMHVKQITSAKVALMKRAGCRIIQIGVESGSNAVLTKINKNITIEQAIQAAEIIHNAGIEVHTFFIIGFPDETVATLKETFEAMLNIKSNYIIFSIFTPYPGTKIYESCLPEESTGSYNYLYNHQNPQNYFCKNIPYDTFRKISGSFEEMIDKKNKGQDISEYQNLDFSDLSD